MQEMAPRIERYMTPAKHWVTPADTLTTAKSLMEGHAIRHLPVVDAGAVVGIVTMSDLYVMEATFSVDPDKTAVEDAMSRDVYTVPPAEPLERVVATMAERYIGSALVVDGGKLIGLFTTTDACRVLAELLAERGARDRAGNGRDRG